MKHLTYKIIQVIRVGFVEPKKCISVPKQYTTSNTSVTHTEPAWNPAAAPVYSPTQNFANSPKSNFDHVNCSDDQN